MQQDAWLYMQVNMETMEMYSPVKGKLRRTNHDGIFVKFSMSDKDYSLQAKIGYAQVKHTIDTVWHQIFYGI